MFVGRKVRVVAQVMQFDVGSVIGKSIDDHQLIIKGSPPPHHLSKHVEIIGIADTSQFVAAEIWTSFGDNFGTVTS
ncbi:Replication protein A 14 kDa subunit B [Bienertia sinuspersici]